MRAPPAVSLEARPGRAWRVVQTLLHAGAALALAAWAMAWLEADAWGWIAVIGAGVAAARFGWHASAVPDARLDWNGATWTLRTGASDGAAIQPPQVMLDLGRWMLLRCRPEGGGHAGWLAVDAAVAGASWHLFRAAVYSSALPARPRSAEERPPN